MAMDMKKFSLAKHDPEIQEFIAKTNHKVLAQWGIDCLNRIFFIYEERYPNNNTLKTAIDILNSWMQDKITMWEARKYCWTVLKLAREIESEDKVCCQIARATSHCLAICHVPTHAEGVAMYVISAIKYLNKDKENVIEIMEDERKWQINHLKEMTN